MGADLVEEARRGGGSRGGCRRAPRRGAPRGGAPGRMRRSISARRTRSAGQPRRGPRGLFPRRRAGCGRPARAPAWRAPVTRACSGWPERAGLRQDRPPGHLGLEPNATSVPCSKRWSRCRTDSGRRSSARESRTYADLGSARPIRRRLRPGIRHRPAVRVLAPIVRRRRRMPQPSPTGARRRSAPAKRAGANPRRVRVTAALAGPGRATTSTPRSGPPRRNSASTDRRIDPGRDHRLREIADTHDLDNRIRAHRLPGDAGRARRRRRHRDSARRPAARTTPNALDGRTRLRQPADRACRSTRHDDRHLEFAQLHPAAVERTGPRARSRAGRAPQPVLRRSGVGLAAHTGRQRLPSEPSLTCEQRRQREQHHRRPGHVREDRRQDAAGRAALQPEHEAEGQRGEDQHRVAGGDRRRARR